MKKTKKAKKSRRSKGGVPMRAKKVNKAKQIYEETKDCNTCRHYIPVGPNQRACMYGEYLYKCKNYQSSLGGYAVRL